MMVSHQELPCCNPFYLPGSHFDRDRGNDDTNANTEIYGGPWAISSINADATTSQEALIPPTDLENQIVIASSAFNPRPIDI